MSRPKCTVREPSCIDYSIDNEEMEEGVRCVAALIFDHQGKPAASVSITGAAMRVTPDRIKLFGNLVNNCALTMSRQLGYNPAKEIE